MKLGITWTELGDWNIRSVRHEKTRFSGARAERTKKNKLEYGLGVGTLTAGLRNPQKKTLGFVRALQGGPPREILNPRPKN